jgi:uncharacterized protein (TIGR01777 family)
MRIVVAGGSGLIGRHLVASLAADGHSVVVLSRHPARARPVLPSGTEIVEWTAGSTPTGAWQASMAGADAVVSLVGASIGRWPWSARRRQELIDSRLLPTRALVQAMADLAPADRPHVFASASGTDIYEGRDDSPATEATPPAGGFLADLCLQWEAEARAAEPLGVRVVALRMGIIICAGAPALARMSLPVRLFVGGTVGSGRQWISWVDIADAVGLIRLSLESAGLAGPLNVCSPDPRRQRDVAVAIARTLHRPTWVRTPAWAVRLVLGEQAVLILGSRRVSPERALAAGYRFVAPTFETAVAAALGRRAR